MVQKEGTNFIQTPRSQSPASGRGTPVNIASNTIEIEPKVFKPKDNKDAVQLFKQERGKSKEHLYMVVIGHVDAGKSTLMGHLLCALGQVIKDAIQFNIFFFN